jgi:hypothetical protein
VRRETNEDTPDPRHRRSGRHSTILERGTSAWLVLERELAACRYATGDWDRAVAGIEAARQPADAAGVASPAIAELLGTRGACLLRLGRSDEAEAVLDDCLARLRVSSPEFAGSAI